MKIVKNITGVYFDENMMTKRKRTSTIDTTIEHPAAKHRYYSTRTLVVDLKTPIQHLAPALQLLDDRDVLKVKDVVGENWPTRAWRVGVLDARGCQSFHLLHAKQIVANCGWMKLRGTKVIDQLSRKYEPHVSACIKFVMEGVTTALRDQYTLLNQDPIFQRSDLDPFELKDEKGVSIIEHAIQFEDTELLGMLGKSGVLDHKDVAFQLGQWGYMMTIESAVQNSYVSLENASHVFYGALNREQNEVVDWFMMHHEMFLQNVDPARVLYELSYTCFPFSSVAAIIPPDPTLATPALLKRTLLYYEANFGLVRWCAHVLKHEWPTRDLFDIVLDQHEWSETKLTDRVMQLVGVGCPLNEEPDNHTLLHALANPRVSGDCILEMSKLVTKPENLQGNGRWDWLKDSCDANGVKDALSALNVPLRDWKIAHGRHSNLDLATYAFLREWYDLTYWLVDTYHIPMHPTMEEALNHWICF